MKLSFVYLFLSFHFMLNSYFLFYTYSTSVFSHASLSLLSFIISLSPFFCPYRANLPMFTACLSYLEIVFVMSSSQFLLFILFVSLFSLFLSAPRENIQYRIQSSNPSSLTLPAHGFSGISLQCRPSPCSQIYVP
jgi:hypothetical protein